MSRTTFNVLQWSLALVLGAALLFFWDNIVLVNVIGGICVVCALVLRLYFKPRLRK